MRVTDMRGVDLARYRFDTDLTLAVLLAHADGHVYHRYGGRDAREVGHWLGVASFERVLRSALAEHALYAADPRPPEPREPLRLEEVPAFMRRDKGECIHCHNVRTALYEDAVEGGRWEPDDQWRFPPPGRIGLDLDTVAQDLVASVAAGSPAEVAGLRVGDRLIEVGGVRIATATDLMWALDRVPIAAGGTPLTYRRGDVKGETELTLEADWKRGTPASDAWRPFKWVLTPAPGFGGQDLDAEDKAALGIPVDEYAFRVTYQVTWGDNARYGREANRAGLQTDDVFLSAAGKRDFRDQDHFHAWWRMTRKPGEVVSVEVLRSGRRQLLSLRVLE